jgi:hypothetical protein
MGGNQDNVGHRATFARKRDIMRPEAGAARGRSGYLQERQDRLCESG